MQQARNPTLHMLALVHLSDPSPSPEILRIVLLAGECPERVAVVRDAFTVHDQAPRPLNASVQAIGETGGLAVAAEIAEPQGRLLVDEYQRSLNGSYALQHIGQDLLR